MDQFVGQVIAVGFNFAPAGWVLCNGQLLAISEYSTLFTLIGTTFGGNGQTTFAVPDLRGRSPVGQGAGTGLSPVVLGQASGTESVTLNTQQIPAHPHPLLASPSAGTLSKPATNTVLANQPTTQTPMYGAAATTVSLAPASIGSTGGSLPHENRQPYNTVNYIMSTFGVFPTQN